MNLKKYFSTLKQDKFARIKFVAFFTMVYNFLWSIVKFVFGLISSSYLYCISGIYTFLIAFAKKIFVSNHNTGKDKDVETKALIMGILLCVSAVEYCAYCSGIYFWKIDFSYSLIWAIIIALCSFVELVIAIFNLVRVRKQNDILLFSLRICNTSTALFALVTTQIAILSTQSIQNTYLFNATLGVIVSLLVFVMAIFVIIKSTKLKIKNKINLEN